MTEVAISRMIRANAKNGPIGSGDGRGFVAFGGDSAENDLPNASVLTLANKILPHPGLNQPPFPKM